MPPLRTLIHVCCGPCLIAALDVLRAEPGDLAGYFYNPNIHPFLEFRKRIKGLRVFSQRDPLPLEIDEEYGLDLFVREIYSPDPAERCRRCHRLRLLRTAQRAREQNFDAFTTTLLGSPHRDHEMVRRIGEEVAGLAGLQFLYRDMRPAHDAAHDEARRRGIYLQQYCGCCFSEHERYKDTAREVYRGGKAAP